MNEKFNSVLKDRNITMYRLAKETGVPYSTISHIYHGKTDINRCSLEVVDKLATRLEVAVADIQNPVYYLKGSTGKYRGIAYKWIERKGEMHLELKGRDINAVIPGGGDFSTKEVYACARAFAEIAIDQYLQRLKFDEECSFLMEGMRE